MLKLLGFVSLFNNVFSSELHVVDPIMPGYQSSNEPCLSSAGYSWCESTSSCERQWLTPCPDNYENCDDCHTKQAQGVNIACPSECDIHYITDPMPPIPTPPTPMPPTVPPIAIDPPMNICPDVMCLMYCENGFEKDQNNCDICLCSELEDICDIPYNDCDNQYVCPKVTEITQCSNGGINGYTTYQISIILKQNMNIKNVYALYGSDGPDDIAFGPMILPPSKNIDGVFGSNLGGVSDKIISINPDSRFDSWLTIGITNGNINNDLNTIGIDFSRWDETNSLIVDDGAIFKMDPDVNEYQNEIILGQFTISSGTQQTVILNIQGKLNTQNEIPSDNIWSEGQMRFELNQPESHNGNNIPLDCTSWFDGCNTCRVNNGILGPCTRLMCFREERPYCISTINGH